METTKTKLPDSVDLTKLTICGIAMIIQKDWKKVNYASAPYLEAMHSLEHITDNYIHDSGISIVLYFLCNATTWRGETARQVKAELKRRCK